MWRKIWQQGKNLSVGEGLSWRGGGAASSSWNRAATIPDVSTSPAPASALPDLYLQVATALGAAQDIVITTHLNPDGDGIGAGLALLIALERMGKRVRFLCPSKVAPVYAFLPEFARIEAVVDAAGASAQPRADVIISCDAGDRERIGAVWGVARGSFINLDHHSTNTNFGDLNVVDLSAESTGVAVSRVLTAWGAATDRLIAECLYTTIVFDTGRFMHSNTTAHTFRWTADLLETGIDASVINRKLTYTRTVKDLSIQKLAIEHLRVDEHEPRLAGIILTEAAIAAVGEPEDWGDMVEIPRSLRGNEVAFLLREKRLKDGTVVVRASLRSNPPYKIGDVALAFGGGGHQQAAGATIPGTLDSVVPDLMERLRKSLRNDER